MFCVLLSSRVVAVCLVELFCILFLCVVSGFVCFYSVGMSTCVSCGRCFVVSFSVYMALIIDA